uniref:Negative elongation factor complex member A n=2 Tax=Poeciliinae TaxID=586240 RepID=A0A3B5QU16_XIPMA
MASMKDSDTGLWLHNKLGSTDELWTPPSIASLLTVSVIDNIRLCFSSLSPPVKLKLLLGMLHLPRRTVDEMKEALSEIIQLATVDSEPWVLMVADILKSFPETGSLNLDLEEQNPNVQDILGELREKVGECEASAMLPLECQYLNKNALTTLVGPLTPPVKHFQLKRKPKSATLRAELLQKSTETAQQLKKTAGVPFHAKGRGLVKKIDTTTPLKGIPKAPFRSPTAPSLFSPPSNRTPIPSPRTPLRKERGVKLLDISELDMVGAGREAKRRRKTLGEHLHMFPLYIRCRLQISSCVGDWMIYFPDYRTRSRRKSSQRRVGGGEHHSRLRCWPRLCSETWGAKRESPALYQLPAGYTQHGSLLLLHSQLRGAASQRWWFWTGHAAGSSPARGVHHSSGRRRLHLTQPVQAADAHVQRRLHGQPRHSHVPQHTHLHAGQQRAAGGRHRQPAGDSHPAPHHSSDSYTDTSTYASATPTQKEPLTHERPDVRRSGDVQDRKQGHQAREGSHSGVHGWIQREPVPGAGGHHPDQAERAHGGSAQSRRHRQHDHAGRHGLRNELFDRTVDPPQEIQTHHQHFLKGPNTHKNPRPKIHTHTSHTHKKKNTFMYTNIWAKSSSHRLSRRERILPFTKMESFLFSSPTPSFPSFTVRF